MSTFDDLLVLQQHDTTTDQLRHRLAALPERAKVERHREQVSAHEAATAEVQASRDAMAKDQRRIEDEVASAEAKVVEVDKRLYGGSVTSPRELQALQDDLASLKRRQGQLEDQVLDVMEQIEPLDADLAARAAERAELDRVAVELEAARVEAEGAAGTELTQVVAERAELAPTIPADLLAHYEDLRRQLGGIAVARLMGANCGGCHLTLPAMELDHIRHEPPDAWVHCEECGRLLVR